MATPDGYYCTALTGGGADALDLIDGTGLADLDIAIYLVSNVMYWYILDADYGDVAESSPDTVKPDANYGTKMWVLQNISLASPGDIGETAAGSVRGTNTEVYKTENADSPLTAQECAGTIVSNYGMTDADCTIALPAAAEGLAFVCILPTAQSRFFRLDAVGGNKIYLDGIAERRG